MRSPARNSDLPRGLGLLTGLATRHPAQPRKASRPHSSWRANRRRPTRLICAIAQDRAAGWWFPPPNHGVLACASRESQASKCCLALGGLALRRSEPDDRSRWYVRYQPVRRARPRTSSRSGGRFGGEDKRRPRHVLRARLVAPATKLCSRDPLGISAGTCTYGCLRY